MFFEKIDSFGYSLYEMCLLFVIWSFLGWAIEVCVHALKMGEYSNRGFLSMPVCPIYGVGVLIITIILKPFMDIPFVFFLLSALICTSFELLVGVGMQLLFHNKWWDYSDEHFNFKGYICLKVSIEWGFGCLIVEYFIEPSIEKLISIIPHALGTVFLGIMAVLIIIDLINSVSAVYRLNLRLKEISEISGKMYDYSQELGKRLADTALEAADAGAEKAAELIIRSEEAENRVNEIKNEFINDIPEKIEDIGEKLKNRYDALVAFSDISDRRVLRLIKAFPSLKSVDYGESLDSIREKLSEIRRNRVKK